MNRLALQSLLLGAQMLGLENVVVVQGDPFSDRDLALTKSADDYQPTGLIAGIRAMNEGVDFRGANLRESTNFCIGATFDLGRGIAREAALAARKVESGADFLMSQPIFDPQDAHRFSDSFERQIGAAFSVPVFYGLQILVPGGVLFSSVPNSVRDELEGGRSGVDMAVELYGRFREAGLRNVYLMPPIRRGGARDYDAAREFLGQVERN
jgi:homocysteine S-methyltransferase